jgi:hypothetical protein
VRVVLLDEDHVHGRRRVGLHVSMPEVDAALRAEFEPIFGPTEMASA